MRADDTSITGPDTLEGKKLCSVTGSTSAQKVKDKYPGVQLQEFGTYSECVAALVSKGVDALTTDNTILAGYASQEQYKGKLKVVGKTFSEERYGVGIKKGDTEMCTQINEALTKMVDDGAWQSWDETPLAVAEAGSTYAGELAAAAEKAGTDESIVTGEGRIGGHRVAVIAGEFRFLAGSIGRDAAGRITAAVRRATAEGLPVLATTASGGTLRPLSHRETWLASAGTPSAASSRGTSPSTTTTAPSASSSSTACPPRPPRR